MIAAAQSRSVVRDSRDPSPQEVARRRAEIRRSWTSVERRRRSQMARLFQYCLVDAVSESAA